jgi:Recombination endonuclease VII
VSGCKDCAAEGVATRRVAPYPGPRCWTHHRQRTKSRSAANHERRVQAVYGLAQGDYQRLYVMQGARCAGCRRSTGTARRLAVDHNHATGEVRGLLCKPCNRMVGWFRDDPETFLRLADYLTSPPARRLLGANR